MAKATKKKTTKRVTETHDGTVQGKRDLIEKLKQEVEGEPWTLVGYTSCEDGLPRGLDEETNFNFWITEKKTDIDHYKVEITVTKL
jgi:hypothetical protein